MPNVYVTFPEIAQSVSRPIIYDIISQVEDIVKINKSTKVYFPGDNQRMSQPGSSIDHAPFADPDRDPLFENDNYLFIEVEEDFETESLSATNTTGACHNAIFADNAIGVYLAPMYATSMVTIHFKYRTKSKTEALRWRDDIRMRVSQMRDVNLHDISYHYPLPGSLVRLLRHIHTAREAKHGYGEDFADYIKQYSVNRLTMVGDLANKEAKFAISETQMRIVGLYGFDGIPEKPELEQDIGTYTIAFDYKFTYERPLACQAKYPVMVHNQLLPQELIQFVNKSYDLDNVPKTYSPVLKGLSHFEAERQLSQRIDMRHDIVIPEYDDFVCRVFYSGTSPVMTVLCELDEQDMVSLFNLRELGDYALDENVLDFISNGEYNYLTDPYKSVINVSVYDFDNIVHHTKFTVDSDLNVKFVSPANPRGCYRVRISLMTNFNLLPPKVLERMTAYPKAFVKLITAVDETLLNHPGFWDLGKRSSLPAQLLKQIQLYLTGDVDALATDPYSKGIYKGTGVGVSTLPIGFSQKLPQIGYVPIYGRELKAYQRKRMKINRVSVKQIVLNLTQIGA